MLDFCQGLSAGDEPPKDLRFPDRGSLSVVPAIYRGDKIAVRQ